MRIEKKIQGIHHITAIASSATENLRFYEDILGLRLVKQTVNFDDPYTYHLYYGDAQGSPGTILTFFPWENLGPGRPGTGMISAINFSIPRHSIEFWKQRLKAYEIAGNSIEHFGDPVIQLADPNGLTIELTGVKETPTSVYWTDGPVDKIHAIAGFHAATATLKSLEESQALLIDTMGMQYLDREHNRHRFKMDSLSSPGHYYDIVVDPQSKQGRPGAGTVHHIAFRTGNDTTQLGWRSALSTSGAAVTAVRDRNYFRSVYFHAPESVLFEIATDPPGFTVDEPLEQLGSNLKLPKQYEPMRNDIERHLSPLRPEPFRHVFKAPQAAENPPIVIK